MIEETEQAYADFLGKEKTEQLKAFFAGTGPAPEIEEELFLRMKNLYNFTAYNAL